MSDKNHTAIAVTPSALPERVHPVVAQMMAMNPDPATLRELMALQREWEAGEAKREFTTALVNLKRDLPTVIGRDKKVDFSGATYASLAHILDSITETITAHGFSLAWEPKSLAKDLVEVTCRLTHAGGHSETCTLAAPPETGGKKSPPQAVASTVTLLQRYTACSLLGLASKDMPDAAQSPQGADTIDPKRSMAAAAWLREQGHNRAEAETHLGKPIDAWTIGDLDALKAWVKEQRVPGAEG
jgi:hypothetical protein